MSSFFKAIGKFLRKIWDVVRKVLAVVLIIIAVILVIWACIFCPPLGGVLFGFALTSTAAYALAAVLLVGAFLIDSETAHEVVGKIGEAAGDAAGAVAGAVGDTASGVLGGLFSSDLFPLLLVGVGGYFLLTSRAPRPSTTEDTGRDVKRKGVNPREDTVIVGELSQSSDNLILEA